MAVRVTHRVAQWQADEMRRMAIGLTDWLTVVHRDAVNLAPVDTGNLVASGRIDAIKASLLKLEGSVSFGGNGVRYARRRHYENLKNPQTLKYLERAGDKNSRNLTRYLRGL